MAWSVHHKGPVWEESCGAGTQWFSSDEQSQHCSADTSSREEVDSGTQQLDSSSPLHTKYSESVLVVRGNKIQNMYTVYGESNLEIAHSK